MSPYSCTRVICFCSTHHQHLEGTTVCTPATILAVARATKSPVRDTLRAHADAVRDMSQLDRYSRVKDFDDMRPRDVSAFGLRAGPHQYNSTPRANVARLAHAR